MPAADAATIPLTLVQDGERVMRICNACRYCEGFCAVFPAIERRLVFAEADLVYLANLCHNCGECYHACPYTPPHEYAINVPQTLAQIRQQSYRRYAWPAGIFGKGAWLAAAVLVAGLIGALLVPSAATDFYAVIPHEVMAIGFSAVALAVVAALATGLSRFTMLRPIHNPRAFPYLVMISALYLHLGPFARRVAAEIDRDMGNIESGRWRAPTALPAPEKELLLA